MRLLAVSDRVAESLYTPTVADRVGKVDLVLGCGDVPYDYLEYLMTVLNTPLLYVHGNHDPVAEYCGPDGRSQRSGPDGGEDIDGRGVTVGGARIAGLEGSVYYRPNDAYQYSQSEMWLKAASLAARLSQNRLTSGRCLDVLITHAPPFGIHDGADAAHVGFRSFLPFMRFCRPRYLLHGHMHRFTGAEPSLTPYAETTVINVYPYRVIEL